MRTVWATLVMEMHVSLLLSRPRHVSPYVAHVCCIVLQCVVLQCGVALCNWNACVSLRACSLCVSCCTLHIFVAVCCSVLRCVAACCSVLQCIAVCCSVLQCVAMCCSVSQGIVVFIVAVGYGAMCCSV